MDNIAFKTDLLRGAKGEKGDAGSTESVPTDGVLAYVGETTPQGYEEIQVDDVFTDIYADIDAVKDMISDAYDPTATYAVGDYCIYNNVLYKCNTAIATPEAFTPAKWDATNVAEELADLTDRVNVIHVPITSTTDLNNCTDINTQYEIDGANSPINSPNSLYYNNVIWNRSFLSGAAILQFFASRNSAIICYRFYWVGAGWSAWKEISAI